MKVYYIEFPTRIRVFPSGIRICPCLLCKGWAPLSNRPIYLNSYIYIYLYIPIYIPIYTYIYLYIYIHTYIYIYTFIYIYIYLCACNGPRPCPPPCAGAAGPPSEGPGGPRRAQHMRGGHGRGPLHAYRSIYIYIYRYI